MKSFFEKLGLIILVLGVAYATYWVVSEIGSTRQENSELAGVNKRLQWEIDSLNKVIKNAQGKVDTLYEVIHHYHTIYDTIFKEVPLLPSEGKLSLLDSLSGDSLPKSLLWEDKGLVAMQRIEYAVLRMLKANLLEKENQNLYKIILEKDGQINELYMIVERKDGQIKVLEAYLVDANGRITYLEKKLFITTVTAGTIILFLTALLL